MDVLLRKTINSNTWIYVCTTKGDLYVGIKATGGFQHSSFMYGATVASAGLLKVRMLRNVRQRLIYFVMPAHYNLYPIRSRTANSTACLHSPVTTELERKCGLDLQIGPAKDLRTHNPLLLTHVGYISKLSATPCTRRA